MSGTVPRAREAGQQAAGQQAQALAAAEALGSGRRRRGRQVAAGLVVAVVVAAGAVAWLSGVFRSPGAAGPGRGAASVPTAAVTREDLSAVTPVSGTLGYSGSYTVSGHGGGTLTQLPAAGKVIRDGRVLWRGEDGAPGGAVSSRGADREGPQRGGNDAERRRVSRQLVRLCRGAT